MQRAAVGAEHPVPKATLAVRLQNRHQLLRAARRGSEHPDLLARERLAVAIGEPSGDRGVAAVAHPPGGPEHRYSAADAAALATPLYLLADGLGSFDARGERGLDPQRQRDRLGRAGHADVAGEVRGLRSQLVPAGWEPVVWDAGHQASALELGWKRLPDARALHAQLDLSASDARHPFGYRDRHPGRIFRGRGLESELRRLRVVPQHYGIGAVLLGLVAGLVASPDANLGLPHGDVEAFDARDSASVHHRWCRPRRIAQLAGLVERHVDRRTTHVAGRVGHGHLGRVMPVRERGGGHAELAGTVRTGRRLEELRPVAIALVRRPCLACNLERLVANAAGVARVEADGLVAAHPPA